jgi:hypothetical protein
MKSNERINFIKNLKKKEMTLMLGGFYIACKLHEIYPPSISDLLSLVNYSLTANDILRIEIDLIIKNNF